MKRLFFFARDPGGMNALIPIIMKTSNKYQVFAFGKDYALECYQKRRGNCIKDIMEYCSEVSEECLYNLLGEVVPDLIITGTSSDDFTEKYLWMAAKRKGIKTIALIDSWVNYAVRFSQYSLCDMPINPKYDLKYLPNYIFTIDNFSKQEMLKVGIPEERIYVTGQPHLEYIKNCILEVPDEEVKSYRQKIGCLNNTKLVVFASDNISDSFSDTDNGLFWGYNEKTIFPYVYEGLSMAQLRGEQFVLLIRPHPKEDANFWYKVCKEKKGMKIIVDNRTIGDIVLRAADLIISMQSMFLVEAALVGKQIISLQIGLKKENPFILDRIGIVESILDYETFKRELLAFFSDKRRGIFWDVSGDTLNRINDLIEEILWQN